MEGLLLRGKPVNAATVGLNLHGNREKLVRPEKLSRQVLSAYYQKRETLENSKISSNFEVIKEGSQDRRSGHEFNFY